MSRDVDPDDVSTARTAQSPRARMTKHRISRARHGARRTAPADRIGPRLRDRRRGDALLRHGTSIAIVGGVALTACFGIMAYRTTSAQDAARAAAKARLLAYERHQYELQQAALARVRAQQQAAARAAQLAALRNAQAQARARQLAAVNAAAAVAAATPTSTPVTSSASTGTSSGASSASVSSSSASPSSASTSTASPSTSTPVATSTPSATPSAPVATSGGS